MRKRLVSLFAVLTVLLLLCSAACAEGTFPIRDNDLIYLGVYEGEPVAWLVLDAGQTNMGTEGVFLITEGLLDINEVVYDEDSTLWEGSLGQQWCSDFNAESFTPAESALIPPTTKHEDETLLYALSWREVDLREEQVFFLSVQEVDQYYGSYSPDYMYTVEPISLESYWWLRSPHRYHEDYHGIVLHSNMIHDYLPFAPWCARPCINLSVQDAVYLLPADDTGALGEVSLPTDEETHAWKLLAELPEHSFRAETVAADSETLTVQYSGADTGSGAVLSLLVRDRAGEPLSLRRLESPAAAEGTLTLSRSQLDLPEGGSLALFCEQLNAALLTNYASPLQALETELPEPTPEPTPESTPEPTSAPVLSAPAALGGHNLLLIAGGLAALFALVLLVLALRRHSAAPIVLLVMLLALAAVVYLRLRSGQPV